MPALRIFGYLFPSRGYQGVSFSLALDRPKPHNVPTGLVVAPATHRAAAWLEARTDDSLAFRPYPTTAAVKRAIGQQRILTSLPPASAVWHEPAAPAVAPASAEEQAARAEANCRLAIYVTEHNMSRKEANEFSDLLANMEETMKNIYSTESSLRNAALDHLGVLRYPECKEAEE